MSIVIPTKPLIPRRDLYSLDVRSQISAFKAKGGSWIDLASVLDQMQSSSNRLEKAIRSASDNTFDEIIIKGAGGALIGWIGSRPPYFGAWFKQVYIGADGPDTAPFFADVSGDVIIGKNGSLALQDGGGNEVGWLGVQADAAKAITGATNATPVVVTVAAHGYETGDTVFITGVLGNTAANGYRIVEVTGVNTFAITDLDGIDVAGSGTYTTGGTSTRYFGGGRFQTMAIGTSFTNYKLRAYADGQLKIKDALITLTDVANNGYIEFNPSTGPTAIFRNTLTGIQADIVNGIMTFSNYITPGETNILTPSSILISNASADPSVFIRTTLGGFGVVGAHDASGSETASLNGEFGTVSGSYIDAAIEYRINGTPGIDDTSTIPTSFSFTTSSAITSVDFGASTTTSGTFVDSITYTDITFTNQKGILTSAI
jgi:hypothetical protein